MLQNLLADRFSLLLRRDTKEAAAYNLVVVNAAKLKLSEDQTGVVRATTPDREALTFFVASSSMAMYADLLQSQLGRVVVDKTGLKGLYDFDLPFPELNAEPPATAEGRRQSSDRFADLLPSKVQEELGLKLEPVKTSAEVLVIERVAKPTAN